MKNANTAKYIKQINSLRKYSPPGHAGTINVRLFDSTFCANFEMVLGVIEPGGIADRHHHDIEHQALYVLSGTARVTLDDDDPVDCGPGCAIALPPGLDHIVESMGPDPLQLIIVYSPPLPPRDDSPIGTAKPN